MFKKLMFFVSAMSFTCMLFNCGNDNITPSLSPEEAVAADKESLAITYAEGDSETHVTKPLTLPGTGANATTINWTSSDTGLVKTTGLVSRPKDNSNSVTLTALITKEGVADTKSFVVTVLPVTIWTDLFGSSAIVYDVVSDKNGYIYAAGRTGSNVDGQIRTGSVDILITKYDINGTKQWTRLLGGASGTSSAVGIALDSTHSNVYVVGSTDVGLDSQALIGTGQNGFVTKYDSSGNIQWTRLIGKAAVLNNPTKAQSVALDSSNNIYISGYTDVALVGTVNGIRDSFLRKYDSSGTELWTVQMGVAASVTDNYDVAVDSNNNVYLTGYTSGNLNLETLTGQEDVYITKHDPSDGTILWTKLLGVTTKITNGRAIAIDLNNNIYISGYTYGALEGETLIGLNKANSFVAKYNTSGTKLWNRQTGSIFSHAGTDDKGGLAVDSSGNVFIVGSVQTFYNGVSGIGTKDAFMNKYNSDGVRQWTTLFGLPSQTTYGYGATVDENDNAFAVGSAYNSIFITNEMNL